jgi:dephospho-CoA kinase
MKLIGITGGVGMGKSTAQALLAQRGIPVVDTDQIARALVGPGQPALAEIQAQFGREIMNVDGTLNRLALAKIVFSNPDARRRLEAILHPRIRSRWLTEAEEWRRQNIRRGMVVIPLLYETDAASHFDAAVCVACSTHTQCERLDARGWAEEDIQGRLAAQWPVQRKLESADYVVWTEGNLQLHADQWDRILGEF